MSLEEKLLDFVHTITRIHPKLLFVHNAFDAGKNWSDKRFNKYSKLIAKKIAKDSVWSHSAGKEWPQERFLPYAEMFAKRVAEDSRSSYFAGKNWRKKAFTQVAEILAEGVAKDPQNSYDTGLYWKRNRFLQVAEIIAEGVAKNSELSYEAGREWRRDRFLPVAGIIAEGVAKREHWSYQAGKNWSDERFLPVAEMIASKVSENPGLCFYTVSEWSRYKFLKSAHHLSPALDKDHLLRLRESDSANKYVVDFFYSQGEKELRKLQNMNNKRLEQWYNFAVTCDSHKFASLPLIDFHRAADVLDYVRPQEGGVDKFFESFLVILHRGEVRPWTREILKRIESVGKGGSNYRVAGLAE